MKLFFYLCFFAKKVPFFPDSFTETFDSCGTVSEWNWPKLETVSVKLPQSWNWAVMITNAILKKYKKNHVPAGETFRHLELKKMVLPMRFLKRVWNLYLAVSKHKNLWHFSKTGRHFWVKNFFFDTPHFFQSKTQKKSIFRYSIFIKKIRFTGGNSILNSLLETISSFRPVSKKRPETVWNCQSFSETGWKKKGLFCKKQGKRTVSWF